jgi:hypothetical protein
MILNKVGIFGWKEPDENLVLSCLLTGDPLLLIANHGCAKTHLAAKLTEVLGHFLSPREQTATLAEFLAKFAELLMRETKDAAWRPGPRWHAIGVNSGSVKRGVLKELREQGLIRLETQGRQKTVYLYRRAYDLLGLKAPTGEGVGGAAHKALVCRMAAVFKRRGYEVHIEQEIGLERKRADLVCYGKGHILGIEMGLSDVRQELRNLRADLAAGILDLLLFVTTDRELLRQVRTRASEDAELAPQLRRLRFLYFPEEDGL